MSWRSRAQAEAVDVYVPSSVRAFRTFARLSDGKLYDKIADGPLGTVESAVHTTRDALPAGFPADGYTPDWVDYKDWANDDSWQDGTLVTRERLDVFMVAPSGDAHADAQRVDLKVLPHVTLALPSSSATGTSNITGLSEQQQKQLAHSQQTTRAEFAAFNRKRRRVVEEALEGYRRMRRRNGD